MQRGLNAARTEPITNGFATRRKVAERKSDRMAGRVGTRGLATPGDVHWLEPSYRAPVGQRQSAPAGAFSHSGRVIKRHCTEQVWPEDGSTARETPPRDTPMTPSVSLIRHRLKTGSVTGKGCNARMQVAEERVFREKLR